jgi:hypothetical protein
MARHAPTPYNRSDFVRLALAEFSGLRDEFEESNDLLHLQMHAFTRLMQRAKGAADWDAYKRGVNLAAGVWRRADEEVRNALNVSFLEHLDFEGPRGGEAWQRLTSALQAAWSAMKDYNDAIASRSGRLGNAGRRKHR